MTSSYLIERLEDRQRENSEARQAFDDMFNNALKQLDGLLEGTYTESDACATPEEAALSKARNIEEEAEEELQARYREIKADFPNSPDEAAMNAARAYMFQAPIDECESLGVQLDALLGTCAELLEEQGTAAPYALKLLVVVLANAKDTCDKAIDCAYRARAIRN